ncbi:MAG: glycosyltransferase, partial [Rhodothermia bacterium]
MSRPDLCSAGTVLFVGLMPPEPGGSSIVDRNLVACFAKNSVVVATAGNRERSAMQYEPENLTYEVLTPVLYSRRVNHGLFRLQVPVATRRLARIAREIDARVIIGTHPTFHLLEIARRAARHAGIPWIAYLHDTLAEATRHFSQSKRIQRLQDAVFEEASHVLVMSEGMSAFYRDKYRELKTTALEHIYPMPVRTTSPGPPAKSKAFWAGNVYGINARSFSRLATAGHEVGIEISMTSAKDLSTLERLGIDTSAIDCLYYPDWSDYHDALNEHEILLLALDWPDESPIHRDELATIFPTKTPEYLASGRPILVHCPENYFLARFFREHGCGTVVCERSLGSIEEAFREIRAGGSHIRAQTDNALAATSRFLPERIAGRLKTVVDAVAKVRWG